MTIDRETLMAYADGELDELTRRRVEQAIAADPALARQVEADRALRTRLAGHYTDVAVGPVPDRLRVLLDTNVRDIGAARARRAPVKRWLASAAAIAATLVIGVMVGRGMGDAGPLRARDGTVIAQAALAKALDTQLASAQPANAATRIGISFRNAEGGYCRTFKTGGFDGLACRAGEHWLLRTIVSSGAKPDTEYRQAASMDPTLLAAAQAMIAGDPLDAQGEAAARDRNWR